MSQTPSIVGTVEVREHLAQILASPTFASSVRHQKFLTYVVEETLAGRSDRIKAYSIATCAFGRKEDFDPQTDSIVRIEAGRLRRQLEHYYYTEGKLDAIRIVIPKGTYVPQFLPASDAAKPEAEAAPAVAPPQGRHRGPRIFVAPFQQYVGADVLPGLAESFTRQVILGLTRFSAIEVYGTRTGLQRGGTAEVGDMQVDPETDFVLSGTLSLTRSQLFADLLLQDAATGHFVWAERYERPYDPAEIMQLRDDVADAVARTIAQPHGVLFSRVLDDDGPMSARLSSFRAVVGYYNFTRSFDRETYAKARRDLEQTVAADPTFAEGLACLSRLYCEGARFALDAEPQALTAAALSFARRAIDLAPNSSAAYHALALALWFSQKADESVEAYRVALALNPNAPDLMADLGLRYAMRMQWERGLPMIEESYRRNPNQTTAFHTGTFLFHFHAGRYQDAYRWARKIAFRDVVYSHLTTGAAAAELGLRDEARAAVAEIERIAPGYGRRLSDDLSFRNLHPDLIDAIARSIRKAGLRGVTILPPDCASDLRVQGGHPA